MDKLNIINSARAFEITGGDKELFCQMFDLFTEIASDQIDRVHKAISNKDLKELSASAHDIKSSASSFAAEQLYDSAFNLEQNAKKNLDLNTASKMINELEVIIQETIQFYRSYSWESNFKEDI